MTRSADGGFTHQPPPPPPLRRRRSRLPATAKNARIRSHSRGRKRIRRLAMVFAGELKGGGRLPVWQQALEALATGTGRVGCPRSPTHSSGRALPIDATAVEQQLQRVLHDIDSLAQRVLGDDDTSAAAAMHFRGGRHIHRRRTAGPSAPCQHARRAVASCSTGIELELGPRVRRRRPSGGTRSARPAPQSTDAFLSECSP